MSINRESCFTVRCDDCGRSFGNDDEGFVLHFTNTYTAVEAVLEADWLIAGERTVCVSCTKLASCRLLGHEWSAWHPAAPQWDDQGPARFWRDCAVCWDTEATTVVDPAVQEQDPGSESS
jgi:hypothetical protein